MNNRELKRYNNFIAKILPGACLYNFEDKERQAFDITAYTLDRTQKMFTWKNLPESIPERELELMLQVNGNLAVYHTDGRLYAFTGGLGGEPDVYYRPTIYTIANPALNLSKNLKIDEECVLMRNDSLMLGLIPLISRYATLITETTLSMKIASINSRIMALISAPDDRTKASAEKYLGDIEAGKMGVIGENAFLEGIKSQPYATTGSSRGISELIELLQYQKASMYNELGLNANFNMKREALNSAESGLNDDALFPLIDDMLDCRKKGAEEINNMFGTDISVELSSSWKDNRDEIDAKIDILENEKEEGKEEEKEEENVTTE